MPNFNYPSHSVSLPSLYLFLDYRRFGFRHCTESCTKLSALAMTAYCCCTRYSALLRARRLRNRIPDGSEIFHTRPDRPWGPPSLLYNGYRVFFPGVQRPGRGVNNPPPSSAEVKGRVELYLYSLSLGLRGLF